MTTNKTVKTQAEELLADENYDGDMSIKELQLLEALLAELTEAEKRNQDTMFEAGKITSDLHIKLTEAEESLADSKARERRYREALEDIVCRSPMIAGFVEGRYIARQALQNMPEEQS